MYENWSMDLRLRAVETLHRELLHEAEQRRLIRSIRRASAKTQRPRRLTVILALLGMQ